MCGITGILGAGAEDPGLLRRMMDRLAHRGPDDQSRHQSGQVALGHTRLAIIDRASGREPFFDEEGRRVIIYNGEIYNHERLREELTDQGHRFTTKSDGEAPLHLLAAHRDPREALRRLDGMFAFAHYDEDTERLVLARDPYGIKPLFYTQTDDAFVFASEMKALLAHPAVPAVLNPDAVREKAVFEYLLPGTSWLKGIHRVPPGCYLETDGHETRIERYHEPRLAAASDDLQQAGLQIHHALERAVEKQLMSEVPLGVILSGGLDSSLVAAYHARSETQSLTFSAAWDESNPDFQAARRVADHLGTTHHETLFDREDLDRDLADVVWSIEDIDHETYFFHPLFRMAKKHATVLLCGQGADEVFGGYARYQDLPALQEQVRERTRHAFPHEPERHESLLQNHYQDLHRLMAWESDAQLEQFQLRLVDRSSMAFSTEVRVPFLDADVVALGRGLPSSMLLGADEEKLALREAARHVSLPPDIIRRPKIPAGRRTGGGVVESFEADALRHYTKNRREAHPYGDLLEPPGLVMLDLMTEIFIEHRGAPPRGLHWNDIL